jgi:Ca2+-binding RTX toxin-like protein
VRRTRVLSLAAGVAGLALVPAVAGASSVRITGDEAGLMRPALVFDAAAGESNRVTVRNITNGYSVRDAGATLTPGVGCTQRATDISCPLSGDQQDPQVNLGDRNDVASITWDGGLISGGLGNDNISLGDPSLHNQNEPSGSNVFGGAGNDRLAGGAMGDSLFGEDGNDFLDGKGGDDFLVGGAGNDVIVAGRGSNTIHAGAGNDTVYANNHRYDVVRCGSGRDIVFADRTDTLVSCEHKHLS